MARHGGRANERAEDTGGVARTLRRPPHAPGRRGPPATSPAPARSAAAPEPAFVAPRLLRTGHRAVRPAVGHRQRGCSCRRLRRVACRRRRARARSQQPARCAERAVGMRMPSALVTQDRGAGGRLAPLAPALRGRRPRVGNRDRISRRRLDHPSPKPSHPEKPSHRSLKPGTSVPCPPSSGERSELLCQVSVQAGAERETGGLHRSLAAALLSYTESVYKFSSSHGSVFCSLFTTTRSPSCRHENANFPVFPKGKDTK